MNEATTVTVMTTGHALTVIQPPGAAGTVNVTVTTPLGTSPVTGNDQFTFTNAPIVTGVTPSSGPTSGGTTVAITGLQMTTATKVTFGSVSATSFHVTSATKVTAVDPAQAAGTVNVTVTSPKGTSIVSVLDEFTYTSPGYWEVASDGGIFSFGDAQFYGSMGGKPLNKPIVGMAATPTGGGYWLVASDGGIFAFGDAQFYGSMGGQPLNQPIVGMAATPDRRRLLAGGLRRRHLLLRQRPVLRLDGRQAPQPAHRGHGRHPRQAAATGWWPPTAASSPSATASFYGSMGGKPLNKPIVGMAATPDRRGYWMVATDGGIFSFGDAIFYGSMGGKPLNQPIVGMAATPDRRRLLDGGLRRRIFSFGTASFHGSMGGKPLNKPVGWHGGLLAHRVWHHRTVMVVSVRLGPSWADGPPRRRPGRYARLSASVRAYVSSGSNSGRRWVFPSTM